jgi:hypothetical protein
VEGQPHQRRAITDYFLSQMPDGTEVEHAEKITSQRVYGIKHDVWDVRSNQGRWWVITEPATNLYSHEQHPSMDAVFALHIGLLGRVLAKQALEAPMEGAPKERFAKTWRKYEQGAAALNEADEAEDFQAVGMRCRECLIAFAQEAGSSASVPEGEQAPKRADFKGWAPLIAQAASPGSSGKQLRSYLRTLANETWELVSWLTHASSANRFDGIVALDAVSNLLQTYSMSLIGQERGDPERCPTCGSYQLAVDYRRDQWDAKVVGVRVCEACGWEGDVL